MSDKNKTTDPSHKQLEYIQKTMRENHELRQVCLEVVNCLSRKDITSAIKDHCIGELNRVLFNENDFLL